MQDPLHNITHSSLKRDDLPRWKSRRDNSLYAEWRGLRLEVDRDLEYTVLAGDKDSETDTLPLEEVARGVALTRERAVVACEEAALRYLAQEQHPRSQCYFEVPVGDATGRPLGVVVLDEEGIRYEVSEEQADQEELGRLVASAAAASLTAKLRFSNTDYEHIRRVRHLSAVSASLYAMRALEVKLSRVPMHVMFRIAPHDLRGLLPAIAAQLGEPWTPELLATLIEQHDVVALVVGGLLSALEQEQPLIRVAQNPTRCRALMDVIKERDRQDARWGGARHDSEHTALEWFEIIDKYTAELHQLALDISYGRTDATSSATTMRWRTAMLALSALTVAIMEQGDRPLLNMQRAQDLDRLLRLDESQSKSEG